MSAFNLPIWFIPLVNSIIYDEKRFRILKKYMILVFQL